jgi:hypothetical protein
MATVAHRAKAASDCNSRASRATESGTVNHREARSGADIYLGGLGRDEPTRATRGSQGGEVKGGDQAVARLPGGSTRSGNLDRQAR